jgi:hypothetical protein
MPFPHRPLKSDPALGIKNGQPCRPADPELDRSGQQRPARRARQDGVRHVDLPAPGTAVGGPHGLTFLVFSSLGTVMVRRRYEDCTVTFSATSGKSRFRASTSIRLLLTAG